MVGTCPARTPIIPDSAGSTTWVTTEDAKRVWKIQQGCIQARSACANGREQRVYGRRREEESSTYLMRENEGKLELVGGRGRSSLGVRSLEDRDSSSSERSERGEHAEREEGERRDGD